MYLAVCVWFSHVWVLFFLPSHLSLRYKLMSTVRVREREREIFYAYDRDRNLSIRSTFEWCAAYLFVHKHHLFSSPWYVVRSITALLLCRFIQFIHFEIFQNGFAGRFHKFPLWVHVFTFICPRRLVLVICSSMCVCVRSNIQCKQNLIMSVCKIPLR